MNKVFPQHTRTLGRLQSYTIVIKTGTDGNVRYLGGGFFKFATLLDELLAGRFTFILAPSHFSRRNVQLPLCT